MKILQTGYFLIVNAFYLSVLSSGYGLYVGLGGTFGSIYYLVATNNDMNLGELLILIPYCLLFGLPFILTGGFIGLCLGAILSVFNSIVVSSITYVFLRGGNLLRYKNLYCLAVLISSVIIAIIGWWQLNSFFLAFIPFKDEFINDDDAMLFNFGLFWIVIGTVIATIHYLVWVYGYWEHHTLFIRSVSGGYNRFTYKMPPIPTNLTQYADGELPAEILSRFPIDSH